MSDQAGQAGLSAAPLRQILHAGRITRAHGLRGEVRIQPLTSDPKRFFGLSDCLLVSADEKTVRPARIEQVRSAEDQLIVKLQQVDDRNQAELLRGWFLSVPREKAIALSADQWFICDLVGCAVTDRTIGELGVLTDVLQTGAQDVYIVHQQGQADILVPALKSVLLAVDIAARRIMVDLPAGLYEIYRGR